MTKFCFRLNKISIALFLIFSTFSATFADSNKPTSVSNTNYVDQNNWYFSWGYNKDYWSKSDIHVNQPGLNNNFTVHNVAASDDPAWNSNLLNKDLMVPQYNIRIGYFLNHTHTWAIELSFDHTKYNSNVNQIARITGVIAGSTVDEDKALTEDYFRYIMHNGANHLMLNFVRRAPLFTIPGTSIKIVGVGRFGAGILIPHPINTIFGNKVDVGPKKWGNLFGWRNGWWQVGGWTTGISLGIQSILYKTIYLEFVDKEAYSSFRDIQVYQGRADQKVWLNELILNLGTTF